MSCCDEDTAFVPSDVSRRSVLKGAALVTALVPAAGSSSAPALKESRIKLAFCSQILCIVPYEVARAHGHLARTTASTSS